MGDDINKRVFEDFPIRETERLILRKMDLSDVDDVLKVY